MDEAGGAGVLKDAALRVAFALNGAGQLDTVFAGPARTGSVVAVEPGTAQFGRINDLIHAAAVAWAVPRLLESGERMERASLAAGNDPGRQYDLATDWRIAEFSLGRWDGNDAGRKRSVYKVSTLGAWGKNLLSLPAGQGTRGSGVAPEAILRTCPGRNVEMWVRHMKSDSQRRTSL